MVARESLLHFFSSLTRRKDGSPHPVFSQPLTSLLEVARPAVPEHRYNLVPCIVGERIERKRHRLNEPQSRLFSVFQYRRQFPAENDTMQELWRITVLRHPAAIMPPCLERSNFEVKKSWVIVRCNSLQYFFRKNILFHLIC